MNASQSKSNASTSASPSPASRNGNGNRKLLARVKRLEAQVSAFDDTQRKLQRIEDFIAFAFDRARWELPGLSSLSSQYDQAARREQLGFLHAIVTVNEKLGHETPDDIFQMVNTMAGRAETSKPPAPPASSEPMVVLAPPKSGTTPALPGGIATQPAHQPMPIVVRG